MDPTPELILRIAKKLREALEAKGKLDRCEVDGGMYDLIEMAGRVLREVEHKGPVSYKLQDRD